MTITHIVSFKFSPNSSDSERETLYSSFTALKQKCVRKREDGSEQPYILSFIAGTKNISPEGFDKGFDVSPDSLGRVIPPYAQ